MTLARRGVSAVILALGVCGVGCAEKKKIVTTQSSAADDVSTRDAEASLLATLEATPDFDHCKAALNQLDAIDQSVKGRPRPAAADVQETAKLLRLTQAEAGEYAQPTFTNADAGYLEQSLFLRSAVNALELSGKPPLDQARLVFEWVCRTVYVSDRVKWPGAPGLTLEAGQGSALARAYLILAAWQQVGLHGCFIGPKSLKDAAPFSPGDGTAAPVRLCGVKVDKNLYLFNPATGEPLLGPAGKTPVTWAELSANLELAKDVAGVGQVSQWQVFYAAPLQAITARMAWLQGRDPGHVGAVLAVDLPRLLKEFAADLGPKTVQLWLTESDPLSVSPWRVQERYAEVDRKGAQATAPRDEHKILLVPLELLPTINLEGLPLGSIRFEFAMPFMNLHYGPNAAMHLLARGQFKEATTQLSEVRMQADAAKTRAARDPQLQADFVKWADQLQAFSAALARAQQRNDAAAEANARQSLDAFVRSPRNLETQRVWVTGKAAKPLLAEANFMLALCVHERTLRLRQWTGTPDPGAWKVALDWWDRYLDASAQTGEAFESRDAHAKKLRTQAAGLAGQK